MLGVYRRLRNLTYHFGAQTKNPVLYCYWFFLEQGAHFTLDCSITAPFVLGNKLVTIIRHWCSTVLFYNPSVQLIAVSMQTSYDKLDKPSTRKNRRRCPDRVFRRDCLGFESFFCQPLSQSLVSQLRTWNVVRLYFNKIKKCAKRFHNWWLQKLNRIRWNRS